MTKMLGRVFHWSLTIGNGLMFVTSLAAGNVAWAFFTGTVAAILAWQLTW